MGNEIPDIQITDDSSSIQGTVTQEPASKTFYIRLKPAFATSDKGKDLTSDVKAVTITRDFTSKSIKKFLVSVFQLKDPGFILKLRNGNGSIIPFSYSLEENTASMPYVLEVCERYQNVTPLPRTVSLPTYEQVFKKKMNNVNNRVAKLEHFAPDLPSKQRIKVNEEVKDLNEKMNILERKLADADATQWQGMFKRNPLW